MRRNTPSRPRPDRLRVICADLPAMGFKIRLALFACLVEILIVSVFSHRLEQALSITGRSNAEEHAGALRYFTGLHVESGAAGPSRQRRSDLITDSTNHYP